jgi:hypothetical protein
VYDGPADDVASSVIETMGKDILEISNGLRHIGAQTKIGLTRFMRRMIKDT